MPNDQTTLTDERREDEEDWVEEPSELPRRPRRRPLGVGGNPIPLALLAVLLIACGFIGGVLVEKGQSSSSSTGGGAGGLAARFAALRSGASATGARSRSAGAGAGGFPGAAGAGRTSGEVSYLSGNTMYVTDAEGNTVKVVTSAGTTVTKTVRSRVKSIHPGETVTILGAAGKNGIVNAETISVGSTGGGLAALFGAGRGGSSTGTGGGASGGDTQALFGNGG